MSRPRIVLVAAMGANRVIGIDGRMPWHLPADLAHFRKLTLGKPVIMGRRTFEAVGKPLSGRRNIVLSRSRRTFPDGVGTATSLDQALGLAEDAGEVMIIGGERLYMQALPLADAMELTFVDAAPNGDTFFPEWSDSEWILRSSQARPADADNPHGLVFCRFERKPGTTVSEIPP